MKYFCTFCGEEVGKPFKVCETNPSCLQDMIQFLLDEQMKVSRERAEATRSYDSEAIRQRSHHETPVSIRYTEKKPHEELVDYNPKGKSLKRQPKPGDGYPCMGGCGKEVAFKGEFCDSCS
jgi:hypothetical protein